MAWIATTVRIFSGVLHSECMVTAWRMSSSATRVCAPSQWISTDKNRITKTLVVGNRGDFRFMARSGSWRALALSDLSTRPYDHAARAVDEVDASLRRSPR